MSLLSLPVLTFDSLLDEFKFNELIRMFASFHDKDAVPEETQELKPTQILFKKVDYEIIPTDELIDGYHITGHLQAKEEYVVVDLYKDYLIPALELLFNRFKNDYLEKLDAREPYDESQEIAYAKRKKAQLLKLPEQVIEADHLNAIHSEINQTIYRCMGFLNSRINPSGEEHKIAFDFKRNELIVLFHTLYKKDKIIGADPAQLAARMEEFFLYKNKMPLQGVYKELNLYEFDRSKKRKPETVQEAKAELQKVKAQLKSTLLEILS